MPSAARTLKYVNRILRAPFLLAALTLPLWNPVRHDSLLAAFGLMLLGALARIWSNGVVEKGMRVSRTGPYALVRHPMYFGTMIGTTGWFLLWLDPYPTLLALAALLLLEFWRAALEESRLRVRFGEEYDAYVADVPMLLPSPIRAVRAFRSGDVGRGFSFSRLWKNGEVPRLAGWLVAMVAVWGYADWSLSPFEWNDDGVELALMIVALAFGYVAGRATSEIGGGFASTLRRWWSARREGREGWTHEGLPPATAPGPSGLWVRLARAGTLAAGALLAVAAGWGGYHLTARDALLGNFPANVARLNPAAEGRYSFAVMGDVEQGTEVFERIMNSVAQDRCALVVVLGDLVENATDAAFDYFTLELDETSFEGPVFAAIGNHDMIHHDRTTFRRHFGRENFFFRHGDSLFVIFDGEPDAVDASIGWLDEVLARERPGAAHAFLFTHRQMIQESGEGLTPSGERIVDLVRRHSVTAVFASHMHTFMRVPIPPAEHIITGGAGGELLPGSSYHYVRVAVEGPDVSYEPVPVSGPDWQEDLEQVTEAFLVKDVFLYIKGSPVLTALAALVLMASMWVAVSPRVRLRPRATPAGPP